MSRTISAYIDIDLHEFDDADIVAEIIDRDLVTDVLVAAGRIAGVAEPPPPPAPRDLAADVLSHLMCRRLGVAVAEIDRLIAAFVPPAILAAREAVADGDTPLAICELERYIAPSLAATIDTASFEALRRKTEMEHS